nr:Hint domain-containing protein [Neoroseomonas eburnea]
MVLTPSGPTAVEDLAPGAVVLAVSGGAAPFQTVVEVRRVRIEGPVIRIRASALTDGAPHEDLLLPPRHALLLDGTLIAAGKLVDGYGILWEAPDAPLEAIDLVLAAHDAVLAGGAAVETAPAADAPPCAPRREPDGALRALLSWRAEVLGLAPLPAPPAAAAALVSVAAGTLRDRLAGSPLAPVTPPAPPLPEPG